MSGRFTIGTAPTNDPHEHVVLRFDDGAVLSYTDHRRFGLLDLTDGEALERHELLCRMGPEPLSNSFSGPALADRLAGKRTPIKAALLDQTVVAGLGNIYVCEALFHAGLSPRRQAFTVQGARAERLVHAIREVLGAAIAAGGSTLRDYAQASGELGYFQHRFAVYDREGETCPGCDCDTVVRRIVQSNRSTFYCAKRQR
jgi:formamidopyrimidine-DNA glycosylase